MPHLVKLVLSCIFLKRMRIPYKDIKCWNNVLKPIPGSKPSDKTLLISSSSISSFLQLMDQKNQRSC